LGEREEGDEKIHAWRFNIICWDARVKMGKMLKGLMWLIFAVDWGGGGGEGGGPQDGRFPTPCGKRGVFDQGEGGGGKEWGMGGGGDVWSLIAGEERC